MLSSFTSAHHVVSIKIIANYSQLLGIYIFVTLSRIIDTTASDPVVLMATFAIKPNLVDLQCMQSFSLIS